MKQEAAISVSGSNLDAVTEGQTVRRVAHVCLPTPAGEFDAHAFECASGFVYLALVKGEVGDGTSVLTRVHSECLTGDALGSLRCDCGIQLQLGLRAIAAEGRGVLVYATGHEGRGIGLVNKLRAYMEQESGLDTLDANVMLGLPADGRTYAESARVLATLGVSSVRLLSNNPAKASGLQAAGIEVESVEPIVTAPHARNVQYLDTKRKRMGHREPTGGRLSAVSERPVDVTELLGDVTSSSERPYVVLKYAQTLDGRIATTSGDSKWISGPQEREISHGLRAACDAILVGVGTVVRDDPQLTVRLVAGASPLRVVLDSTLRTPPSSKLLDGDATTIILTTERADPVTARRLTRRGVGVRIVPSDREGVDIPSALEVLAGMGVRSLLVEGGAGVITSMLAAGVVDRVITSVAPTIMGAGTESVGELGIRRVSQAVALINRSVHLAGDDVLFAADVVPDAALLGRISGRGVQRLDLACSEGDV